MNTLISQMQAIFGNRVLKKKILITIALLALYRFLVFVPVPFVDITTLISKTLISDTGLEYFAMLLGGTIDNFSLIAVGLVPYINASIIMQLLGAVVPALEELQEQGEQGQQKIQQYTRWLSFPLALLQGIGMVYFINYLLGGAVISTDIGTILMSAFALAVGSMLLIWIGELITEYGISNGTSLIIFASIVAGISSQTYTYLSTSAGNLIGTVVFMLLIIGVLMLLTILLIKTRKDIPVVYARQGGSKETASLPIPLNPVGMIPIIFSVAFVTFPYLVSQIIIKLGSQNPMIQNAAKWIETNFNIYTQQPALPVIIAFFLLIVLFTFFYALITFNPEKMADTIQKR
jgi:preprotein translocase subunit SecY